MAKKEQKQKYDHLAYFRFKKLRDRYLLTNDQGRFIWLGQEDFDNLLVDKLNKNSNVYLNLVKNNFIKKELNISKATEEYRLRKSFVFSGPKLHIMVITLRCNHKCLYCHASAQGMHNLKLDMDKDTAHAALDIIFNTTSPYLEIELQGGEPLANWAVLQYIVEQSGPRARLAKKSYKIKLVSNFSLLSEEKLNFLIKHNVELSTSLDGPKELHDKNRIFLGGSSHKIATKWAKIINNRYSESAKKGYNSRLAALLTVSKHSLKYPQEIIDEYLKLGFNSIFLWPLNPFGIKQHDFKKISYSAEQFLRFYRSSLDYVLEINSSGNKFVERFSKYYLQKMLTDKDPGMLDMRSPCGAGIGQLAYNYNGDIYPCDEARMLSAGGDDNFKLGNVFENKYKDIVAHPNVRSMCSASCLESMAGCSDCAYLPYCGTCPVYNYSQQGNIYGQMPASDRCKISMGVLDYLFEKISNSANLKIFKSWLD